MNPPQSSLEAAAADRKARLARLAALKRKQPEPEPEAEPQEAGDEQKEEARRSPKEDEKKQEEDSEQQQRRKYLSGRNYDFETENVKLGFEHDPRGEVETLEERAERLAKESAEQAKKEQEENAPIDLFKLQPKKPNWDLKRDLDEKLKVLNVRTENAIARLVRERIQNAQQSAESKSGKTGQDGENVGMEGVALVEGVHQREAETSDHELDE